MTRVTGYAAACALAVGSVTALLWPFLDGSGRAGVLAAGGVALPLQCALFAGLVLARERRKAFLSVWLGGILVRMALVFVAGWIVWKNPALPPLPTLLAFAGFLFGMLLLEPFFFPSGNTTRVTKGGLPATSGRPLDE